MFAGDKNHKTGCAAERIGPAVHLPVSPTQDLCSNILVDVLVKVQAPRWEVGQQLIFGSYFCGCSSSILEHGYSFATVVNKGSFESPRPPPSIRIVGR